MTQRVILARLQAAAGRRGDLLSILEAHAKRCLEGEPGTLQFDLLCPDGDADTVIIFERYEDQAAMDAHSNGASIKQARVEMEGLVSDRSVDFCDIVA